MKKNILLLLSGLLCVSLQAQNPNGEQKTPKFQKIEKSYRYRIAFTDKKNSPFSVKQPEKFLSAKAIERRKRYKVKIDEHDLPVNPAYIDGVSRCDLKLWNKSKWNNTAVFEMADTALLNQVRKLPYVKEVRCVWISPDSLPVMPKVDRSSIVTNRRDTLPDYYGHAEKQVKMLAVDQLHQAGFTGKGVTIAVIDGGFLNADLVNGLKKAHILGTRNFAHPDRLIYDELMDHGTMVLSCIAANEPKSMVGTAPDASFYLMQSEDGDSEQLIEEDNWCAAVEYADSLGCDIVTSSLGYFQFDHDFMNHTYAEQNGHTALNSRSASLAASRGLMMLNSAGNSGNDAWKRINFPGDAPNILTVGAVNAAGVNAVFSSLGNTTDGRVKPDVMAIGEFSALYGPDGCVTQANGTSFSTPTMCGAVACLVQQFPNKRPAEIIRAVQQSGNNVAHPDNVFGYGIPNMMKAAELLKKNGN